MPRIALYDHVADNVPQSFDYEWPELVSMLTVHDRRTEKDGPLWSPVRIEGSRANENVLALTVAVFDLDVPKKKRAETEDTYRDRVRLYHDVQLPEMADAVEGYDYVAYSTHSHEPGATKLRLVLRLSREVLPREWPAFWRALTVKFKIPADEQRKDLSGIYYLPAAVEGAEVISEVGHGKTVDVDEILASAAPTPARVSRAVTPAEVSAPALSANLDALREAVRGDQWGSTVLKGTPIGEGRGNNHQALLDCFNELARKTLDFQPEAVLELLEQGSFRHPEHYGTDPAEEFWLMFPGQREHWEQRRAEQEAARALAKKFAGKVNTKVQRDQRVQNVATSSTSADVSEQPAAEGTKEPEEEERHFNLTDSGNAERLVYLYGSSFLCASKRWYVWTGKRFDPEMAESLIQQCAKDTVRSMVEDDPRASSPEDLKFLAQWAQKSESAKLRRDMVALAAHEDEVACSAEVLDADPWLFNAQNCTVELRGVGAHEHDKRDKITKTAGCEYQQDAKCPLWLSFLSRVFGADQELVAFMQRFVGYCLTGDVGAQVFLFLWGEGANGKSTFCQVVAAMLGEYATFGAPDLLLATYGERHTTELADLQGRRLVICQETEAGRALAESRVKQLTGGDKIKARRMHQDFFEFNPTHKLILAGNHLPVIRGTDLAIWRRVCLVPFEVTIPPEERDPKLLSKLLGELPGILNWAVEGCRAWQDGGLKPPYRVVMATDGYKKESDQVREFVQDLCIEEKGATVVSSTLYASYNRWAEAANEKVFSHKMFSQEIGRRGFIKKHTAKGQIWQGIRLKTAQDTHLKVVEGDKDVTGNS